MRDLIENIMLDLGPFVRGWWDNIKSLGFTGWCVILIITFFVYVMIQAEPVRSYSKDMNECMADGYKSYECRGIMKGARSGK